jgi:hypothetical protein
MLANDSTLISDPQDFVNWHNRMIFMGKWQYAGSNQLWITDGTLENTRQIFNDSITGWSPIKGIAPFTLGGDAFFVAQFVDSIGAELYKLVIDTAEDVPAMLPGVAQNISIYPNPVTDRLVLEAKDMQLPISIKLVNLCGETVFSTVSWSASNEINLEKWQPGVYLVLINDSKNNYVSKVIKK